MAANHAGNVRFREIIRSKLPQYNASKSKLEKSLIVTTIVDAVRDYSPDGGFIKQDKTPGAWYDVGDALAREKIGQTIRDQLHSKYKSSTKSKKQRRKALRKETKSKPDPPTEEPQEEEELQEEEPREEEQRPSSSSESKSETNEPPMSVESDATIQKEQPSCNTMRLMQSELLSMMILPLEEDDLPTEGEELWDRTAMYL